MDKYPCFRYRRRPNDQKEVQTMAKMSEKYEVMYIINPNFSEEQTAAIVEKFKALVEAMVPWTNWRRWVSASSLTKSTTFPRVTMS